MLHTCSQAIKHRRQHVKPSQGSVCSISACQPAPPADHAEGLQPVKPSRSTACCISASQPATSTSHSGLAEHTTLADLTALADRAHGLQLALHCTDEQAALVDHTNGLQLALHCTDEQQQNGDFAAQQQSVTGDANLQQPMLDSKDEQQFLLDSRQSCKQQDLRHRHRRCIPKWGKRSAVSSQQILTAQPMASQTCDKLTRQQGKDIELPATDHQSGPQQQSQGSGLVSCLRSIKFDDCSASAIAADAVHKSHDCTVPAQMVKQPKDWYETRSLPCAPGSDLQQGTFAAVKSRGLTSLVSQICKRNAPHMA